MSTGFFLFSALEGTDVIGEALSLKRLSLKTVFVDILNAGHFNLQEERWIVKQSSLVSVSDFCCRSQEEPSLCPLILPAADDSLNVTGRVVSDKSSALRFDFWE